MNSKICTKCLENKILDNFSKNNSYNDGYVYWCKECVKNYDKKDYQNKREKKIIDSKIYYNNNTEIIHKKSKIYYQNNKEYINERSKNYVMRHQEKTKEYKKQWSSENRGRTNKNAKERRLNDKAFRIISNLRTSFNTAFKRKYKTGSAIKNLGCSADFLVEHLQEQFTYNMSWNNYGKGPGKWEIDHIIPMCSINPFNPNDIKIVCNYKNLRPLWHEENQKKKSEDIKLKWKPK